MKNGNEASPFVSHAETYSPLLGVVALFLCIPLPSWAAVSITEIMYDLPGTDSKHEWVEVMNGGAPIDLSVWKLFEGGSNHGLTPYSGSGIVPTNGYAIFADDPATFLSDYPGFSGIVFDVALSGGLNNTDGETLTVRDDALTDHDTVTYTPNVGAQGDGNSLQKVGSVWKALSPTPGKGPSGESVTAGSETPTQTTTNSNSSNQTAGTNTESSEPKMTVSAGDDRTVVAGASTVYKGAAVGLKGEPLENARLVWSFGNGDSKEGPSVLYAYPLPGKYVVTLDASSGKLSATDRITVTVLLANVAITDVTETFVEITNRSKSDLDIGLWYLSAHGELFMFPEHTVILPSSSIAVAHTVSNLTPENPDDVVLLYPNGTRAAVYEAPPIAFPQYPAHEATLMNKEPVAVVTQTAEDAFIVAPIEEGLVSDTPATELAAAAALADSRAQSKSWYWFLGLGAIIILGIGGVYVVKRKKPFLSLSKHIGPESN